LQNLRIREFQQGNSDKSLSINIFGYTLCVLID
jgi:hypothetical protein